MSNKLKILSKQIMLDVRKYDSLGKSTTEIAEIAEIIEGRISEFISEKPKVVSELPSVCLKGFETSYYCSCVNKCELCKITA